MSTWMIDYETYSSAPLKQVGAWSYASHGTTMILLCAIAKDDEPPLLWDYRDEDGEESCRAVKLLQEMVKDTGPIVAHNAGFEIPITHWNFHDAFGIEPPDRSRWRCTAAMCRRAAIPWSLKEAAIFLKLDEKKIDAGKKLISIFCVDNRGHKRKADTEENWKLFGQYCRQDVEVEREIWKRLLPAFSLDAHALTLGGYLFDIEMNQRGIPVNVPLLRQSEMMIDAAMEKIIKEFHALTGMKHTQQVEILKWVRERGYPGMDLRAATMEAFLKNPPEEATPECLRAIELRGGGSYASLKKLGTMIDAADYDCRVRGAFMWSGALRTHRWSGRVIQPQNFKRPTIKQTHMAYQMIKDKCSIEEIEDLWDSLPEVLSSCVRHFIELPGSEFLDADYANIEARITPWLCGQEDMLNEFRRGEDPYTVMAAHIFNVQESNVSKLQRFVGKTAILSAQYGVGWKKFQKMCRQYGRDLSDDVCKLAISRYRETRDKITEAWGHYTEAAKAAIRNPGKKFRVNGKVEFAYGKLPAGFRALQMRLPSGHRLTYPLAHLKWVTRTFEDDEGVSYTRKLEEIQFWGESAGSVFWSWQSTFGSRLLENACQGVGGDFMTHGLLCAARAGYHCFATIHDQALCVLEKGHTKEGFRDALCTLPDWALDFPLEASCDITPFYTKDE